MEKEENCHGAQLARSSHLNPSQSVLPSSWNGPQEDQVSQQKEQNGGVQSMYCKDLVFANGTEFSFEELRAQRYYKWLEEKSLHLTKVKENLKLQIEQKQKLIQDRNRSDQHQQPTEVPQCLSQVAAVHSAAVVPTETAPLNIFSEPEISINTSKKNAVLGQDEDVGQGRSALQQRRTPALKPFTMCDENTLSQKPNTSYNLRSSSVNHKTLKLPTSVLKSRHPPSECPSDKDASISRSEEAIINGHWNKTLCRSPNDTSDFVRAAQLASTPFGGPLRQNAAERALMENQDSLNKTAPVIFKEPNCDAVAETKKLSPIQEMSHEWGHTTLASTTSLVPESHGRITSHLEDMEFKQSISGRTELEPAFDLSPDTKTMDPCSLDVRKALLNKVDLSSFADFNIKAGPLPEADDDLHLDGETLFFLKKMGNAEISLYCSSSGNVLVKMDRTTVAWDFYISSQLRARLPAGFQHCYAHSTCYWYQNGAFTLWRVPKGQTIQDLLEERVDRQDVPVLAVQLLEMVKQMHSCRIVHGDLRPDTLILCQSCEGSVLMGIDFSSSLDLELQSEVNMVQNLPSAQDYIRQGLLSPTASPYQVDFCGVALVVHMLLFGKPLRVEKEGSYWRLAEDTVSNLSNPLGQFWKDFFHNILNPEDKSKETILSNLINNLKNEL